MKAGASKGTPQKVSGIQAPHSWMFPGNSRPKTWIQPRVASSDTSWDVRPLLCCMGTSIAREQFQDFPPQALRLGWYLRLPISSSKAHINQVSTSKALLENPNSSRKTCSPRCSHIGQYLKKENSWLCLLLSFHLLYILWADKWILYSKLVLTDNHTVCYSPAEHPTYVMPSP